jgi:hypothetical protein
LLDKLGENEVSNFHGVVCGGGGESEFIPFNSESGIVLYIGYTEPLSNFGEHHHKLI